MSWYQATLWPRGTGEADHVFYAATDWSSIKPGFTRGSAEDRMKNDRQFKSSTLIGKKPCNCSLSPDSAGRPKCDRERWMESVHGNARLPQSEWYTPTGDILDLLRWLFGDSDRSLAIIDQLERNHRRWVA